MCTRRRLGRGEPARCARPTTTRVAARRQTAARPRRRTNGFAARCERRRRGRSASVRIGGEDPRPSDRRRLGRAVTARWRRKLRRNYLGPGEASEYIE